MTYTIEELDRAIYAILPNIKKAKDEGCRFNRPSLLSMVGSQFFRSYPNIDEKLTKHYDLCRKVSNDLESVGYLIFEK